MEDGDLPRAVGHEEEIVRLVESRHFHVGIGVYSEIHRAGETGNVLVAGLVHRGEQVEEGVPGGVEGHGAFYFYEMLRLRMASASTMTRGCGGNDKRIPPRDPGNSSRAPSPRRYPLEKGIWHGREIPANSIPAAASK